MDQNSLVKEEIDFGADFVRRFDQYRPVKVAFWLRKSEEPRPYLYIASDQIDRDDIRAAYADVRHVSTAMRPRLREGGHVAGMTETRRTR